MKIQWILCAMMCTSLAHTASASPFWENTPTLNDQEMSSIRGGFALDVGQINIGITVIGAIDGAQLLNSHIANLTISNGRLLGSSELQNAIKVLQVGTGNYVEALANNEVSDAVELIGPVIEADAIPSKVVSIATPQPVIGNVIQNTESGRHIEVTTLVNIEANVSTLLNRASMRNQIQEAIRLSMQQ